MLLTFLKKPNRILECSQDVLSALNSQLPAYRPTWQTN